VKVIVPWAETSRRWTEEVCATAAPAVGADDESRSDERTKSDHIWLAGDEVPSMCCLLTGEPLTGAPGLSITPEDGVAVEASTRGDFFEVLQSGEMTELSSRTDHPDGLA